MAVFYVHQGKGFGKILMRDCLKKAKVIKTKRVYLISNTKLQTAISLYKKFGFLTIELGQNKEYSRGNIVLELRM